MPESVARVVTDRPERYVKQLVGHLGNRRTTRLSDDGIGFIVFEDGRCVLQPGDGVLVLTASADDIAGLDHVRDVVARHLTRFGSRDGLTVTWSDPS
jgi:caffeoyl-CoA O-methyltransferase